MIRLLFLALFLVCAAAALPQALKVWGCGTRTHSFTGFKACVVNLERS